MAEGSIFNKKEMERAMYVPTTSVQSNRALDIIYSVIASLSILPICLSLGLFTAVFYLRILGHHMQTWDLLAMWMAVLAALLWTAVFQLCCAVNGCRGISSDSTIGYILCYVLELLVYAASFYLIYTVFEQEYEALIKSLAYFLLNILVVDMIFCLLCLVLYLVGVCFCSQSAYYAIPTSPVQYLTYYAQ